LTVSIGCASKLGGVLEHICQFRLQRYDLAMLLRFEAHRESTPTLPCAERHCPLATHSYELFAIGTWGNFTQLYMGEKHQQRAHSK
jgi:hypothetical protein